VRMIVAARAAFNPLLRARTETKARRGTFAAIDPSARALNSRTR